MPERSAKEQFDRQAAHYNAQWNAWSAENLRWLLEKANPQPTDSLLDIATGTGFTALAFAPQVAQVIGLDVSTGMLAEARRNAEAAGVANVSFQEGAAEALPFPDATFDLVTCRIAAHHFLSVAQFVAETARVLKPGGAALLTDTTVPDDAPELDAWQNRVEALRDPSHVRNYTPQEWRRFMEKAGLQVETWSATGGGIRIQLHDWLAKAGCQGAAAEAVRQEFAQASPAVVEAFQITPEENGDWAFSWRRIVLKARKPTAQA